MHQMHGLSPRVLYRDTHCQHCCSMIRHNNKHSNTGSITVLPQPCFTILYLGVSLALHSDRLECVSQTSSPLMISFRPLAISHIPHSGKYKQPPRLHLISASLQITHQRDYRQLGMGRTPLRILGLSGLLHHSCFVCVWNSNATKGKHSRTLPKKQCLEWRCLIPFLTCNWGKPTMPFDVLRFEVES